jgi:hypothetical protein
MKFYCNKSEGVFTADKNQFAYSDVVVFGFNGIKRISYKQELTGGEDLLVKFSKLSKITNKIIISATNTDNYGIVRKSLIIAEKGKILGISDMNIKLQGEDCSVGGGYRVYQTSVGRIGVLIGNDILDYEGVKSMTVCDADIIILVVDENEKEEYNFILRAYSYLFGVPILALTANSVLASDINGEIVCGSRDNITEIILPTKKCFRLITTKRRGKKVR